MAKDKVTAEFGSLVFSDADMRERLPKPTLIAIHEFLNDEIYFRNPRKEVQDEF